LPYRRLPTTDAARLRALKAAADKTDQFELDDLAFESRYIHPLRNYHQQLETIKFQQTQSWKQLVSQNKQFQPLVEKTRLYLTHFIQVLNMCITRDELSPETRRFYGLEPADRKVPKMISNEDLFTVGKQIIEGESKRIRTGGTPIMNPTIAKVNVWYDNFKDLYHSQQIANKSYQRANLQLIEIRRKADILLPLVWNQVEEKFAQHKEDERRDKCSEYGIIYIFRKSEKKPT